MSKTWSPVTSEVNITYFSYYISYKSLCKRHACEVKHSLCGECPQHLRQQELWLILVYVNRFNNDDEWLLLTINCMLIKINWRICTTPLWISTLKNKRMTTFCHFGPFEVLHSLVLYIYLITCSENLNIITIQNIYTFSVILKQ